MAKRNIQVGKQGELPMFDIFGAERTASHSIRGIGDTEYVIAVPPMANPVRIAENIALIEKELYKRLSAEKAAAKEKTTVRKQGL
jgi:hypothetical protein